MDKKDLEEIMKSWLERSKEGEKAPSAYVRGISTGFKICFDELRQYNIDNKD